MSSAGRKSRLDQEGEAAWGSDSIRIQGTRAVGSGVERDARPLRFE